MPRGHYERKTYEVTCEVCGQLYTVKQIKTRECKPCKKKRLGAESYQRRKERLLAEQKEYRTRNKGKFTQRDKAYRERNLEKLKAHSKRYYRENRERILKYQEGLRREKGIPENGLTLTEELAKEILQEMFPDKEIRLRDRSTVKSPESGWFMELDLYLPELSLAVELHGVTHYKPIYGAEKFERQVRNDRLKREECKRLGIRLVEIPLGEGVHYDRSDTELAKLRALLMEYIG